MTVHPSTRPLYTVFAQACFKVTGVVVCKRSLLDIFFFSVFDSFFKQLRNVKKKKFFQPRGENLIGVLRGVREIHTCDSTLGSG